MEISPTFSSGTMKWRNALLDELPEHMQVVLISYLGIYYRTVFDADRRCFVFEEDPQQFLEIKEKPIYWIEMH
jgi:hypothetical protein